jgi:hypothetical protein
MKDESYEKKQINFLDWIWALPYEHERNNTITIGLQTLKLEERIKKKKIPKQESSKNFNMELISHKDAGRQILA